MGSVTARIVSEWRRPTVAGQCLLRPVSWAYAALAAVRRWLYRRGLRRVHHLPVPVVVVGNLTVGGSGKTPLVAHLVERLAAAGWQPGIVSRGYGRRNSAPTRLDASSTAAECGDEPILLRAGTQRPVAVGVDRPGAAALLVDDCDVIVADDGLQHYPLGRDIEIVVIDGDYGLGNGRLLPAGPLREASSRLAMVDFVAVRDGVRSGAWRYRVQAAHAWRLTDGTCRPLAAWQGRTVHGVAGIGVPGRFFSQLEEQGIDIIRHGFPDHHAMLAGDLAFSDELPILMTEKDAVKCRAFADERMWAVRCSVEDMDGLAEAVRRRLDSIGRTRGPSTA